MNDSPFQMMWVVGIEMYRTTCMTKFPVDLRGQFTTLLHDQIIQDGRVSVASTSILNLMIGSKAIEMAKELLQSCWSMWPYYESAVGVSKSFSGFGVCCILSVNMRPLGTI